MSQAAGEPEGEGRDEASGPTPAEEQEVIAEAEEVLAEAEVETDWEQLATERTADLQRLHAEYVNYKKRVDRDRALARQSGIEAIVADLMPVFDAIHLAKSHDDLEGGFKLVADELEKIATKHGLVAFGEVGDQFDPARYEALMQLPLEGQEVLVATVSQVMQQGYLLGERVVRPARVAVANP